jgi:flagellar hook protein FlgE
MTHIIEIGGYTMLRSMFSGVSGLRNHQVKMDVIGDNISNVNTDGFKASRVTFQQIFAQNMRAAAVSTDLVGGRNPMQVGLGVNTATIDVLHTTGSTRTTDSGLDLAINGDGFFVVTRGETGYEDAMKFYTRVGNFFINPHDGAIVNGAGLFLMGIMYSEAIDDGDLEWREAALDSMGLGLSFYDAFDREAHLGDVGRIYIPTNVSSLQIDQGGNITATGPDGSVINIGRVLLSNFANPPGLTRTGDNLYIESSNSGEPRLHVPNDGIAGRIDSNSLEMSNVDLSREFTEMIITQRGFQANSRIITVSDSLLEELINLKRYRPGAARLVHNSQRFAI